MLFFKQKTAYEMRISDWSSDVCSSDLRQSGEGRYADLRRDACRWWADRQHREVCCGRNGLHVQSHDRPRERRLFELDGAKGLAGRRYGLRALSTARGYRATGLDEPAKALWYRACTLGRAVRRERRTSLRWRPRTARDLQVGARL